MILDMFVNLINEDYIESKITGKRYEIKSRSCSASQKANHHEAKMDQELALAILLSGRSALLTGAAGTGKTYLLNTFIAQARKRGKKGVGNSDNWSGGDTSWGQYDSQLEWHWRERLFAEQFF